MKYLEAPEIDSGHDMFVPSIFLAGGITDCPDWQKEMVKMLSDTNLVIYNPRRKNFPINDPGAARGQIEWEHYYMTKAMYISFWFPFQTLCPIVLYELGYWSHSNKRIFVGVHPDYKRLQDVKIQTSLKRPDVPVVYSLSHLVKQIKDYYATYEED